MFTFERGGGKGQREGDRGSEAGSELTAETPMWGSNHDLSQSWMLNRLSHPGTAPRKVFLNMTQKAVTIKQRFGAFDYIKIRKFYSSEDSLRTQATEWEKVCATHSLTKDSHSEYAQNPYIKNGKKDNPV